MAALQCAATMLARSGSGDCGCSLSRVGAGRDGVRTAAPLLAACPSARLHSSFPAGLRTETTSRRTFRGGVSVKPAAPVVCSTAVQAKAPITFHIGETSLTLPFSPEAARGLDAAIAALLSTFKEKEKAERPKRWLNMEFRLSGDVSAGEVFLEAFCNPNAYSNAFQAKVLITVRDDRMKFTSEGALSAIKADVDQYLAAHA